MLPSSLTKTFDTVSLGTTLSVMPVATLLRKIVEADVLEVGPQAYPPDPFLRVGQGAGRGARRQTT